MRQLRYGMNQFYKALAFAIRCIYFLMFQKKYAQRKKLEQEHIYEDSAWKMHRLKSYKAFHFSSEGEFEQVKPIIQSLIDRHLSFEILFTSPSVSWKVKQLYEESPHLVRARMLPLTKLPFHRTLKKWLVANELFLVRYDLFWDFILLKQMKSLQKIYLISAFLNPRTSFLLRRFLRIYFNHIDVIYPVNERSKQNFETQGLKAQVGDFFDSRCFQIISRLKESKENKKFHFIQKVRALNIESMIWGSCYPQEVSSMWHQYFDQLRELRLHFFYPHHLDEENIKNLKSILSQQGKLDAKIIVIKSDDEWSDLIEILHGSSLSTHFFIIVTIKGILLESYQMSKYCFVGGGSNKGVHSLSLIHI